MLGTNPTSIIGEVRVPTPPPPLPTPMASTANNRSVLINPKYDVTVCPLVEVNTLN